MRYVTSLLVLVLATGILFAQGPGGMMGSNEGSTVMVNTAKGLFVLRGGVLAKYNAATLKPVQQLQLFGDAPTQPADMTDRAAWQQYMAEMQKRMAPAIMIAKDNVLLLVVGDGFARINQDTLAPEKAVTLTVAGATAEAGYREPTPGYLLVENTLYLMRGKEILSINVTDGKILTRSALAKELQPVTFTFNRNNGGGGNRPNGGGGNRPNGGGGNANTPPPAAN